MSSPEPGSDRRKWSRFFRFRLSTLFIATTVLALVLGLVGINWYRGLLESWAVKSLQDAGGTVVLDDNGVVVRVWLGGDKLDDQKLQVLTSGLLNLPKLHELDIVEAPITDTGMKYLEQLKRLPLLYVHESKASEASFKALTKALPDTQIRREKPDPVASKLVSRTIFRSAVVAAACSPDGTWLATGSGDGTLRWWHDDDASATETIQAHRDWLFTLAFSPDGRLLATGGGDNQIQLWDVATRRPLGGLAGHTDDVHAVVFDPAGRWLYSAGDDRTIRVWDVDSRTQVDVLPGHEGSITSLSISPDGKILASGSRDDTIRLWDVASPSRHQLRVLEGHHADVGSVAFSPDGASIASAGYDRMVRVWDTASGQEQAALAGHSDWVFAVRFFVDGKHLASGAGDGTIRVWDLASHTATATYRGQSNISCIRFDHGGRALFSTAADGTIFVRDAANGALLRVLRTRFGDRDLAMIRQ